MAKNPVSKPAKKTPPPDRAHIAVYPGSFDPITLGHVDIIRRIAKLFDEVIVLVSHSSEKTALFDVTERLNMIHGALPDLPNVRVDAHQGLTVDYAQ